MDDLYRLTIGLTITAVSLMVVVSFVRHEPLLLWMALAGLVVLRGATLQ